jgi:hypothetical protein
MENSTITCLKPTKESIDNDDEKQLDNDDEKQLDNESITGLDEESVEYIYLQHSLNPKVWKIPYTAAVHSKLIRTSVIENTNADSYGKTKLTPLVISEVNYETIKFIVSYMNYYDGKKEKCSPKKPIKKIHISYILDKEYPLFEVICDNKLPMKEKLVIYNDYIKSAVYFGFEYLHEKLCAIVANMFSEFTLHELQQLSFS